LPALELLPASALLPALGVLNRSLGAEAEQAAAIGNAANATSAFQGEPCPKILLTTSSI
jgi:hypothetical protein